ncbi:unnamed protein product [Discosporangium mesarthrocarpum]
METLPKSQLVLFTDAYDSLAFPSLVMVPKVFDSMDGHIVFAAERNSNPDEGLSALFAELHDGGSADMGPFRHLNSGQFIGRAGDILVMLHEVQSYGSLCATFNDQRGFTRYYLENPETVRLDDNAQIFLCLEDIPPEWIFIEPHSMQLHCRNHSSYWAW